jgi:hypothetical protein
VTTLGDTQALPRVIDGDPGEPAAVPVPVQLPAARPAPVTEALPTAALRLRPVVSLVPAAPETDEFALVDDAADETPEMLDHTVEAFDDEASDDEDVHEDGDQVEPAGAADSPALAVVPHERIYEEAMASIAALAQNWSEAVDDLYGRGTDRSAA